jgi:hypothetical protein
MAGRLSAATCGRMIWRALNKSADGNTLSATAPDLFAASSAPAMLRAVPVAEPAVNLGKTEYEALRPHPTTMVLLTKSGGTVGG